MSSSATIQPTSWCVPVYPPSREGLQDMNAPSRPNAVASDSPSSDEDWVRRFQSGSDRETAYLELFRRYNSATHGFFRRRIGSPDLASELNQDLHMTVFAELDRFRLECSYRTWLFRLARSRLWHLRRRLRVHLDERPVEVAVGFWEAVELPAPDPENELNAQQRRNALKRCLSRLNEIERAVVFGQYCGGMTLEELTTTLQLENASGARAPLIAAQRKLKRCLQESGVHSAGEV